MHDLRQYCHSSMPRFAPVHKNYDKIAGNQKMKPNATAYISPKSDDNVIE